MKFLNVVLFFVMLPNLANAKKADFKEKKVDVAKPILNQCFTSVHNRFGVQLNRNQVNLEEANRKALIISKVSQKISEDESLKKYMEIKDKLESCEYSTDCLTVKRELLKDALETQYAIVLETADKIIVDNASYEGIGKYSVVKQGVERAIRGELNQEIEVYTRVYVRDKLSGDKLMNSTNYVYGPDFKLAKIELLDSFTYSDLNNYSRQTLGSNRINFTVKNGSIKGEFISLDNPSESLSECLDYLGSEYNLSRFTVTDIFKNALGDDLVLDIEKAKQVETLSEGIKLVEDARVWHDRKLQTSFDGEFSGKEYDLGEDDKMIIIELPEVSFN